MKELPKQRRYPLIKKPKDEANSLLDKSLNQWLANRPLDVRENVLHNSKKLLECIQRGYGEEDLMEHFKTLDMDVSKRTCAELFRELKAGTSLRRTARKGDASVATKSAAPKTQN